MIWTVVWARSAERDLRRLDASNERRIHAAVGRFAESGQGNVKRLVGRDAEWRLRVGDWRVIFTIDHRARTVQVLRVRHRSAAYDE